jgi:sarcosine oxidase
MRLREAQVAERAVDVVVVGAGVMGCAAAYHLAKDGRRVALLEQFALGHDRGSSHGPSRIIRLSYEGSDYVQLARSAFALWRTLETESGASLLRKVGGLDFGLPDAFGLKGMRTTMRAAGVPFEELDGAEIMRRYPQFTLPAGTIGFYQGDYSILNADACVAALASQARKHGAVVYAGEAARQIAAVGGHVEVRTASSTYRAERVILSAGSWMGPLLRQLGLRLPLTVKKEQVAFFTPPDPAAFMPERFPLFIQRFPGTTSLGTAFPIFGHKGVKAMLDRTGPEVKSDDADRSIDETGLERLRAYVGSILPGLGSLVSEAVSCRYTLTPDEDFIIDRHPDHPEIVIASPCSGHGFKFGVVIGRILADLAEHGRTAHPIERFRLDRPALKMEFPS